MKLNKKGFTLIELLVVIAIIGLLSTVAVIALNTARQKSRDAKRVADVKQIQTALEMYMNDCSQYPDGASGLQTTDANGCTGVTFGTFMSSIPVPPTPPATITAYTYTSVSPFSTYGITFTLEGSVGGLPVGIHCASQSGISNAACP